MKNRVLAVLSVLMLGVFGIAPMSAQADLSPGVARVSLIHGDVSTQRGDSGDWAAAALNQPVVSGDTISTGDRSRAEAQLDYANIVRLGDESQVKIATLTRTQIQVQISRGLVDYVFFKGTEADVEIDTPNVAVRPSSKEGVYRIEVNGGDTQVIVRKGEAQISTPQGSARVGKGQAATIRGTAENAEYRIATAPEKDSWDSWNSDRDGVIRNAQSWSHTNRYYTGAEDLDAYGHWITVPDYGPVWSPVVAVGWAPYRAGRWVWEPYWGWTWVSYEPWGWAPYHYGRWFVYNSAWVWWPGPVYAYPVYRPVWAPAYVSFFGFGGNWGVSVGFGFGSVGWLPVGPCDRFYPWYGRYGSRFNVVNVTNITNITNVYNIHNGRRYDGFGPLHSGDRYSNLRLAMTDDHIRRGISGVPTDHFGTGRSIPREVDRDDFRNGRVMTGNLPIVPTRETLSATNRPASPSTIRDGGGRERFFMKNRPAAAPQPFDQQSARVQQAIERSGQFTPIRSGARPAGPSIGKIAGMPPNSVSVDNGQRGNVQPKIAVSPSGMDARDAGQPGRPAARDAVQPGRATNVPATNDGWRRFDNDTAQNRPAQTPQSPQSDARRVPLPPSQSVKPQPVENRGAGRDQGGWRRFSTPTAGQGNERSTLPAQRPIDRPENRIERPSAPVNVPSPRPGNVEAAPSQTQRSDGWQRFTPQARNAMPEPAPSVNRGNDQWSRPSSGDGGWRPQAQPRSSEPRGSGSTMRSSRPPLDLRQPIVTPRSSSPAMSAPRGGGGRGGDYRPPSGGGNRGGAPSGGGHSGGQSTPHQGRR